MKVREYYQQQNESFLDHYLTAMQTGEEEAIHQMRVALKKIFAICSFLKSTGLIAPPILSYLKAQRKLFKLAGDLRDAQIRYQLLKEYADRLVLPAYEQHLLSGIQSDMDLWKKQAPQFSLFHSVCFKVELIDKLNQIPGKHIRAAGKCYILNQLKAIKLLLLDENWANHLHKVRIRLKRMHRIYQLYLPQPPFCDMEKMKATELILGRWHDHLILLNDLTNFSSEPTLDYSAPLEILRSEMNKLAQPIQIQLLLEFTFIKQELRYW